MKNDRIYRIDVRMIRSRLDELAALALALIGADLGVAVRVAEDVGVDGVDQGSKNGARIRVGHA